MLELIKVVIERIPLQISYFLKKVDAHSLQAPFAFSFYQLCKERNFPSDEKIEDRRILLLSSKETIAYHTFGKTSKLSSTSRQKISQIARRGISGLSKSLLLASLIQQFKCKTIIELGTSLGINAAYLAKANPQGNIYSFEGHPELCRLAQLFFNDLEYKHIRLLIGNIDEKLYLTIKSIELIDFIFIDANHSSVALLTYLDRLVDKLHTDSIVVIDDIRWSKDMYKGWKKLTGYDKVSHSFDLGEMGVLFFKETRPVQHYIFDL